jgi:hypothetical protein
MKRKIRDMIIKIVAVIVMLIMILSGFIVILYG